MKKILILILVVTASFSAYCKKPTKKVDMRSEQQKMLEKKLRSIKIKHIEFQEADPTTVFKYLRIVSKKNDPEGKGVNIITSGLKKCDKTVTLLLDDIPLSEVIRYVCKIAGLSYKVEDFAVIIKPAKQENSSKKK